MLLDTFKPFFIVTMILWIIRTIIRIYFSKTRKEVLINITDLLYILPFFAIIIWILTQNEASTPILYPNTIIIGELIIISVDVYIIINIINHFRNNIHNNRNRIQR